MQKKPKNSKPNSSKAKSSPQEWSELGPEELASKAEALLNLSEQTPQEQSAFSKLSPTMQQVARNSAARHGITLEKAADALLGSGLT